MGGKKPLPLIASFRWSEVRGLGQERARVRWESQQAVGDVGLRLGCHCILVLDSYVKSNILPHQLIIRSLFPIIIISFTDVIFCSSSIYLYNIKDH